MFCVQYTRFVRLDLKLEMSAVCLRFVGNMGLIKVYFVSVSVTAQVIHLYGLTV